MNFDIKNRYVIAVDLDNTLTNGENAFEVDPTVNAKNREIVKKLYRKGYIIIVNTARLWEYAPETVGWLIKNRIPFHGIMMGKIGSDFYVDDKNVSFEELERLI